MKYLLLFFVFVLLELTAFSIQWVQNFTASPSQRYSQIPYSIYVEGGNKTQLNLMMNSTTRKWAGVFGNITGNIIISNNASVFYSWLWNGSGVVCAEPNLPVFDWPNVEKAGAQDVDNVFGFSIGDVDSSFNTFTGKCNISVAGKLISDAPCKSTGEFKTIILRDRGYSVGKENLVFCTSIQENSTIFNGGTADYELLIPTNEALGEVQDYVFWLELT